MLYRCRGCYLQVRGDVVPQNDILFEELSTSNIPPSSYKEFHTQYNSTSETLEALELQIRELYASLSSLEKTRAHVVEKKRLYHSILHPIRRLPPEILSEIFRIRSFDEVNVRGRKALGTLDTRKAPWTLSQVCRSWRAVAACTPDLWTTIDVPSRVDGLSLKGAALLEQLLSLQLDRSREQPLSISYHSDSPLNIAHARLLERSLPLLCSRASQWVQARLKGYIPGLAPLCRFGGDFCSLQSLDVHFMEDDWTSDAVSTFRVFKNSPSLKRLTLRGEAEVLLQEGDQIPWQQLTYYEARDSEYWNPDLNEHFRILPKLERLEVCVLDSEYSGDSGPPTRPSGYLELRFLHTLVIGHAFDCASSCGMDALFNWLVLPALRVLRLPDGFDCLPELVACLNRSRCSLEELAMVMDGDVGYSRDFPDNFVRLLKESALHNLETLKFRRMVWINEGIQQKMWDAVFETLTLATNDEALVMPRLRSLTLDGRVYNIPASTIGNHERLLAMVSSRRSIDPDLSCRGARRLKELIFWNFGKEGTHPLEGSSMDQLLKVSSDGLVCNWYWGDSDWYKVDG
ncbi:hypothetical protein AAF712_009276 [Marasmius tenuissimus]|uniref:F-box domain-containing protein n=1 Tax=Marasmius tenuissimus TaxID=585030 RepID=A0ABR2ZQ74_9AGAR